MNNKNNIFVKYVPLSMSKFALMGYNYKSKRVLFYLPNSESKNDRLPNGLVKYSDGSFLNSPIIISRDAPFLVPLEEGEFIKAIEGHPSFRAVGDNRPGGLFTRDEPEKLLNLMVDKENLLAKAKMVALFMANKPVWEKDLGVLLKCAVDDTSTKIISTVHRVANSNPNELIDIFDWTSSKNDALPTIKMKQEYFIKALVLKAIHYGHIVIDGYVYKYKDKVIGTNPDDVALSMAQGAPNANLVGVLQQLIEKKTSESINSVFG